MNNELILNVLYQVLGQGKKTARDNYAFKCPKGCHPTKHKLEINIETHQYQCWICGGHTDGIKGKNLVGLLKKAKAPADKIEELKHLIKSHTYSATPSYTQTIKVSLPKEFKPLGNSKELDIIGRHALAYVRSRGVTEEDILKYNIGYCEYGEYANMVIVPSYDKNGELNYFFGRSFTPNSSKKANPPTSKEIIPFELLINWNLPIILCEGMFDAISIKRNAIPLLGKTISKHLMKQIISSSVKKVYIALDKDAIKQSLKIVEDLMNYGKKVYLVDLNEKDPNDLGFKNFLKIVQNTLPIDQYKLLDKKLSLI
jgi:DNA primase